MSPPKRVPFLDVDAEEPQQSYPVKTWDGARWVESGTTRDLQEPPKQVKARGRGKRVATGGSVRRRVRHRTRGLLQPAVLGFGVMVLLGTPAWFALAFVAIILVSGHLLIRVQEQLELLRAQEEGQGDPAPARPTPVIESSPSAYVVRPDPDYERLWQVVGRQSSQVAYETDDRELAEAVALAFSADPVLRAEEGRAATDPGCVPEHAGVYLHQAAGISIEAWALRQGFDGYSGGSRDRRP